MIKASPNLAYLNNLHSQPVSLPKLLGHRGAKAECLENSADGFLHLHKIFKHQQSDTAEHHNSTLNICGTEFDVQLTADKQLVIFHDDTLSRIYGHQARVDQLTYQELTKLTANLHPIMHLDDIWSLLHGYQHIELEIKTHCRSNVADIAKALLQYVPFANLPITLTSFDVDLHRYMHRCPVLSHYPRGLLIAPNNRDAQILHYAPATYVTPDKTNVLKRIANDAVYLASRLGCTHLGMYHPLINEYTTKLCRRYAFSLSAWTVNTVAQVNNLAQLPVDYIITDYPTLMSSLA